MLRLVLTDYAGAQHDIELYKNEPVNLTYQFTNVQNVNTTVGDFAHTFRVPLTGNNKLFFDSVDNPEVFIDGNNQIAGRFSFKKKITAELSKGGVPLLRGSAQIKRVITTKERHVDVELVVFGETLNLSRTLADKKLGDITYGLDHTINYSTINLSWIGSLASGKIKYGFVDRGQNWSFNGGGTAWSTSDPIYPAFFTPFLSLRELVDQIMQEAGYEYTSAWLASSAMDDVYFEVNAGGIQVNPAPLSASNFHVRTLGQTLALTGQQVLSFVETSPAYDNGGNFASNKFTAPGEGRYNFRYNLRFTVSGPISQVIFFVYKNGGVHSIITQFTNLIAGQDYTYTAPVYWLNAAQYDEYEVACFPIPSSGQTGLVTITGTDLGTDATSWEWIGFEPADNYLVALESNMPDVRCIDFMSYIQKAYNLIILPDSTIPGKLTIEPISSYLESGTDKDWTNKVDHKKDMVLQPTTDLQGSEYIFTMEEGRDLVNHTIQETTGRVYGRHKITDNGNDFATGTKEVKTGFAPFVTNQIPGTDIEIHRQFTTDASTIEDPKPRLAFWNGLVSTSNWLRISNAGVSTIQTNYPKFSAYENADVGVLDDVIFYGNEAPLVPIAAQPLNTLYYKYWRDWFYKLYSDESRMLTCFVQLNAIDVSTFQFNDRIYIKNAFYRILEISNYQPGNETPCKVKLLLDVTAPIIDCEFTPSAVAENGLVTFTDADGTSGLAGSEICCDQYGYNWTGTACYNPTTMESPDPSVTQDSQGSSNNRTIEGSIEPGNIAQGVDLKITGQNNIVTGAGIEAKSSTTNSILYGVGHKTNSKSAYNIDSSIIGGMQSLAWISGKHYGGLDYDGGSTAGTHQEGVLQLSYRGGWNNTTIETLINGQKNHRIILPDNCSLFCELSVCWQYANRAGTALSASGGFSIAFTIDKTGGVAGTDLGIAAHPTIATGDQNTSKFKVLIDATTDTTEHRVKLETTLTQASNYVVTAQIKYTQTLLT